MKVLAIFLAFTGAVAAFAPSQQVCPSLLEFSRRMLQTQKRILYQLERLALDLIGLQIYLQRISFSFTSNGPLFFN